MNGGTKPPEKDRRSSPRHSPRYTPEQISNLRITRVHFREEYLFCLLSDGNMVCVPLDIAPRVAPSDVRYNWQINQRSQISILGAGGHRRSGRTPESHADPGSSGSTSHGSAWRLTRIAGVCETATEKTRNPA